MKDELFKSYIVVAQLRKVSVRGRISPLSLHAWPIHSRKLAQCPRALSLIFRRLQKALSTLAEPRLICELSGLLLIAFSNPDLVGKAEIIFEKSFCGRRPAIRW